MDKIAISDAKYCIKFWLKQKKDRAFKKIDEKAPVHTYTVIDLTKSFNLALEELSHTGVSLEVVKNNIYAELPTDKKLISEICDSLAQRLPAKNLVGYIEGPPPI